MPSPSTKQRQSGARKEPTPKTPNQDGSIASSNHSSQSRVSFDFSNVDGLANSFPTPGIVRSGASSTSHGRLPDEKGFSIQIGSELFKLSGASIMSDAPSYFSSFFIEQLQQTDGTNAAVRTLFIDRDPETFREIARHLQGYLVMPKDGRDFVRLFADAQFYRLPRLQTYLFESDIFVEVGDQHFRVPRDIFSSPGDTPNYFTLGFTVFFSSPGDAFPGLNPRDLLRPPAIHPPHIPNRSPQVFAEILHMLRGYPLTIRNEDHRSQLLKDVRYYSLRGLEQKLIPHTITHNAARQVSEIVIRLEDIKPSQICISKDGDSSTSSSQTGQDSGWVTYARPFVDEEQYQLILQTNDVVSLDLNTMRLTLFGSAKSRLKRLFETVANKLNLPVTAPLGLRMMAAEGAKVQPQASEITSLGEEKIKVCIDSDTHVILDGEDYDLDQEHLENPQHYSGATTSSTIRADEQPRKRRRADSTAEVKPQQVIWTVNSSQWRLRLQPRIATASDEVEGSPTESPPEIILVAVKLDVTSSQKARNTQRSFLSA
ncbi:MAG: hypothetical protein Q9174_004278 [Haloplaca sp. 1 TL-2023]